MSNREQNKQIFEDTKKRYTKDRILRSGISESIRKQEYILSSEKLAIKPLKRKNGDILVSGRRSFEAAVRYPEKKVAVLNFASAKHPGGGVATGANAQEESLCRISTLYPCLNSREAVDRFYLPHRNLHSPFYNDDIIYTPDVLILKTDDEDPVLLAEPYKVDVITCAAPNLRDTKIPDMEQYHLHYVRGERILQCALMHNVDVVILGAFGCGAFQNNPHIVARAYKDLVEIYGKCFDMMEFAIYHNENNKENFWAFHQILNSK